MPNDQTAVWFSEDTTTWDGHKSAAGVFLVVSLTNQFLGRNRLLATD